VPLRFPRSQNRGPIEAVTGSDFVGVVSVVSAVSKPRPH